MAAQDTRNAALVIAFCTHPKFNPYFWSIYIGLPKVGIKLLKLSYARMFSHPKTLSLFPYNPYLPFEFFIILAF